MRVRKRALLADGAGDGGFGPSVVGVVFQQAECMTVTNRQKVLRWSGKREGLRKNVRASVDQEPTSFSICFKIIWESMSNQRADMSEGRYVMFGFTQEEFERLYFSVLIEMCCLVSCIWLPAAWIGDILHSIFKSFFFFVRSIRGGGGGGDKCKTAVNKTKHNNKTREEKEGDWNK